MLRLQEVEASRWQVGSWVRVYGNMRRMDDELSINAFHIRPVANWSEVRRLDAHTLSTHAA